MLISFYSQASGAVILLCPNITSRHPSAAPRLCAFLEPNSICLAHRMSIFSPSSPSTSVPPEIWLQIFQTATYIPGEWDVSATTHRQGLFNSWDSLQWKAYKVVLPLRRTIVQVSRFWWEVGSEVLYTSFHETAPPHHRIQTNALDHFQHSLSSRPALGRFVKRLALTWPRNGYSGKINHVLKLCPNTLILSFYDIGAAYRCLWEPALFTSHVRSLDANVRSLSQKEIVQVLSGLPGLEILGLSGLARGREESRYHGDLRLSLVRLLSLSFDGQHGIEYWTPLLSTADLPRLTSLSTNPGRTSLPFPIDVWQRITFFRCFVSAHDTLKPEIFRSLTHLYLGTGARLLRHQQNHFPFHQLYHLTLYSWIIPYTPVGRWIEIADGLLVLPLNRSEMPLLRALELGWGVDGVQGKSIPISEHEEYLSFLDHLESATLEFERLGVQFQEVYREDIYRIPTPMKDVIRNVRDQMRI